MTDLSISLGGATPADQLANASRALGDNTTASLLTAALAIESDPVKLIASTVTAAHADPCTALEAAGTALGVALTGPATAPDPLDAFFPADPTVAAYPSPEGSTLGCAKVAGAWVIGGFATTADGSGNPSGRAITYVKDAGGAVWDLWIDPTADQTKESGVRLRRNGVVTVAPWTVDPILAKAPMYFRPAAASIRQKAMFVVDGVWQAWYASFDAKGAMAQATTLPPLDTAVPSQPFVPAPAYAPTLDQFFPAAPSDASYPSPEGSFLAATLQQGAPPTLGGTAALTDGSGNPSGRAISYLKDKQGNTVQIAFDPTVTIAGCENGLRLLINGAVQSDRFTADPVTGKPPKIYRPSNVHIAQGQVVWVDSLTGTILSGYDLPLIQRVPAQPLLGVPAPGSTGQTVTAGPGGQYATIQAAYAAVASGGTIQMVGGGTAECPTFTEAKNVALLGGGTLDRANQKWTDGTGWFDPTLTVNAGVGGRGGKYAMDKGMILIRGGDHIVDGVRISNVGMEFTGSNGTGGLVVWSNDAATGPVNTIARVRNCFFQKCMDGIFTVKHLFGQIGPDAVIMDNVWLDQCGVGDGLSHAVYITSTRCEANGYLVTAPNGGHAFKCEAADIVLRDFDVSAASAAPLNLAFGTFSAAVIADGVVRKPAGSPNLMIMSYGSEPFSNGAGGVAFYRVTFDLELAKCFWLWPTTGSCMLVDCTFPNQPPVAWSGPGRFMSIP